MAKRSNNTGSVYEYPKGSGVWWATITTSSGKRRKRKTTSEGRARRLVTTMLVEDATAMIGSESKVSTYLDDWMPRQLDTIMPATWSHHRTNIRNYIVPAIGHVALGGLGAVDVERMFRGMLDRGLTRLTVRHARATLSKALEDAKRDGLVTMNAAREARAPKVDPHIVTDYFTRDELDRLIAKAPRHRIGNLVIVAALTGMRQQELLGLSVDALNLDEQVLHVRQARVLVTPNRYGVGPTKTPRSIRDVELTPRTVQALRDELEARDTRQAEADNVWDNAHDLVFVNGVGRMLSPATISLEMHVLTAAAGVPHHPFAKLRHSHATTLVEAGVDIPSVAARLGHSPKMALDRYAGVTRTMNRKAAAAAAKALG